MGGVWKERWAMYVFNIRQRNIKAMAAGVTIEIDLALSHVYWWQNVIRHGIMTTMANEMTDNIHGMWGQYRQLRSKEAWEKWHWPEHVSSGR